MKRPLVLIADDSPTYRAIIRREIDPDEFDVKESADGVEALRIAKKFHPAIVATKKDLPKLSGFRLCEAIASDESLSSTQTILLTASNSEADRAAAFAAGAVRFIAKSFKPGELRQYLNEVCRVRGSLRGARLLAVEDSTFIRQALSRLLEAEGAHVSAARDGVEALELLQTQAFDAVVTDYHMPRMDGITLLEEIRKGHDHASLPVIFLSGSEGLNAVVRSLNAGANDFIRKPFEATELLARVRSAVQLARIAKRLDQMATTDALTELFNRRHAMGRLEELSASVRRHTVDYACVMLDVDHFKRINDTFGHACGDACLKTIASILRDAIRANDSAYRLGGEEFLVICPMLRAEAAAKLAERIRQAIRSHAVLAEGHRIDLTVSLGVAAFESGMECGDDILRAADEALYEAKNSGRDAVRISQPTQLEPACSCPPSQTAD